MGKHQNPLLSTVELKKDTSIKFNQGQGEDVDEGEGYG